ncbi:MAG: ribonuclease P protein component [Oscillospiraceae bacterium]|nr:ribonuclease P protein component [Oscillospiraceae bacterium]
MSKSGKTIAINQNSDFRRAYARGRQFTHPALVTYINKNRAGTVRIGITASKKIGNAVKRNRARRVIRAAYSSLEPYVKNGPCDIVFVARAKTTESKSGDIARIMKKHLELAGRL